VLRFSHDILKECTAETTPEVSRMTQMVKHTAGPLSEAHLQILLELHEENPRDLEVLAWLGRRYAEKCEFETSRFYFLRAREVEAEAEDADAARETWALRTGETNFEKAKEESDWSVAVWKNHASQHQVDREVDAMKDCKRVDYTRFGGRGVHEGAATRIYAPPNAGWDSANEFQRAKYSQDATILREKTHKAAIRDTFRPTGVDAVAEALASRKNGSGRAAPGVRASTSTGTLARARAVASAPVRK
jgi:hypothetical protein